MADNSQTYYKQRSEMQRRQAEIAAGPEIAAIHHDLASRYAKLAQSPEDSTNLRPSQWSAALRALRYRAD